MGSRSKVAEVAGLETGGKFGGGVGETDFSEKDREENLNEEMKEYILSKLDPALSDLVADVLAMCDQDKCDGCEEWIKHKYEQLKRKEEEEKCYLIAKDG